MMVHHATLILLIKAQTYSVLPFVLVGIIDSYWQTRHYRTQETWGAELMGLLTTGLYTGTHGQFRVLYRHPDNLFLFGEQYFGVTFDLHNPWWWRQCLHSKYWYSYYIKPQKTSISQVAKTSNSNTLPFIWEFSGKCHLLLHKLSY